MKLQKIVKKQNGSVITVENFIFNHRPKKKKKKYSVFILKSAKFHKSKFDLQLAMKN